MHIIGLLKKVMEKLFFWNDIYSPINRHATKSDLRKKEANFSIYTIIYIYQVMAGLYFLDQEISLSKFELEYFVFFSRSHDELSETIENNLQESITEWLSKMCLKIFISNLYE